MDLPSQLSRYAPIPVQAPPRLDRADAPPTGVHDLIEGLLALARGQGSPEESLGLLLSNVTVEPDRDDEGESIAPGDYVSLTLQGMGEWSTDWRWVPGQASPVPALSSGLLNGAGVRFAYGRALQQSAAITVFFLRG